MSGDDEFEDFLRRRRPLFDRRDDDELEPPAELDRLVLRQAREAIEAPKPQRVFRAPRWSMPVALAATLVLAFTVILHTAKERPVAQRAGVDVHNVAREIDASRPAAASPAAAPAIQESIAADTAAAPPANPSIVVDLAPPEAEPRALARAEPALEAGQPSSGDSALVSDAEANRHAAPPPPAPALAKAERADASILEFRRDAKTWMAEIERLRASGDSARAELELAEFKRQHRAYAGAPDR